MDDKETIISSSNLGERLAKIKKAESVYLRYGGNKTLVTDRIVIGRAPDCDIVLSDNLTSRHHAVVQRIKSAYFITDQHSTNGVYVNGKKIQPGTYVRLSAADSITIGRTELHLLGS
ncbi:FHA domain-containing protein [Spirochaeta lutea]|uniref:FHA domain-containing protein n=1 Tax=Spirochaeta lutea TaxID=1480694 RepID=A0A098QXY8_9SPIO|nr:FHA domain-containing protein [Spirochaeta lutea]KGE72401.1 hypothetical protein DC28_06925 [Spirochaeta lutea]